MATRAGYSATALCPEAETTALSRIGRSSLPSGNSIAATARAWRLYGAEISMARSRKATEVSAAALTVQPDGGLAPGAPDHSRSAAWPRQTSASRLGTRKARKAISGMLSYS